MKALLILISALFFNVISACAQITVDGITYSSPSSKDMVGVSFNTDSTLTDADIEDAKTQLTQCLQTGVHPLDWSKKGIHKDINLFFKISGDYPKVMEAIRTHGVEDENSQTSWIWSGATSPVIDVRITAQGRGSLTLFEGEKVVGSTSINCVAGDKRPSAGDCKIINVWRNKAPAKYSQNDSVPTLGKESSYKSWMPWALETNNSKEAIYVHGGSQADTSQSKGCIRTPKKFAEMLHKIVKEGTLVKITLEK